MRGMKHSLSAPFTNVVGEASGVAVDGGADVGVAVVGADGTLALSDVPHPASRNPARTVETAPSNARICQDWHMSSTESIPSDLGCALLGLIARSPSTGYALARRMRQPVGYFWTARHSQIYPELARLEKAGLVAHRVVAGAGPRPTKEYRMTANGRAALQAWVAADLDEQPVRDLETLRLWSVWTVAPGVARVVVVQSLARHSARLTAYEEELASVRDAPEAADPAHPWFASRLTLEGGVRTRRAAVEWCEWMLKELDAVEVG